ncbi:hypothetical protein PISMIDRAFT_102007 [Pisolithus microcarpus 441]|uniref:Glycosyltransferase 61 catalytic domain-containing protein n=1 Tax=Pisolithus microcarpus 441 TaxID=765257 RepID=A0A0C9ZSG0_9AGAM|nr:hypothetical protein PISMIDRAFT_102007 [Pisolithus microcarpus 441]
MLRSFPAPPKRREVLLFVVVFASLAVLFDLFNVRESLSSGFSGVFFKEAVDLAGDRETWRIHTSWQTDQDAIPQTNIALHAPGWTIFDNLYVMNGTIFVVTDKPETIPPRKLLTSTGVEIKNDPELIAARLPTDREMRIISVAEARELFGSGASLVDGVTWIVNDPPQFIQHYYHWTAELFLGFWRTYSSLDSSISESGDTILPAPRRMWFVHLDASRWRDPVRLNQWVLRSSFPSVTMEFSNDWDDRAQLGKAFLLDRAFLSDRAAAKEGPHAKKVGRPLAEACSLPGTPHWWSPIARNVMKFSGLSELPDTGRPVITYISRQTSGRRLLDEDHELLVEALYALGEEYGYEVNVASMEKLSREEQIRLAAQTTIMMGVHGNGLTSLLWMQPSKHRTLMEFYYPGGFTYDYQYTAYSVGVNYYGWWDNVSFTHENLPRKAYPKGFQGSEIPIDGIAVAKTCLEILQT